MTRRLAGAVALVTGAASGIGAAAARRLAAEGAAVLVVDIDGEGGARITAELTAAGHDAVFAACDVSNPAGWRALADVVDGRWGRLDVVHSNAALQVDVPAHELPDEVWDRHIAVNVKPLYLAMRTFADRLRAVRGSLIATSSVHAMFGFPGHAAYDASKGAISALVRQLAVEYAPQIRVNAVVPGPIETPVWSRFGGDGARRQAARETPLARLGAPADVAAAVAFLASPDASFITGSNLVVDGGWSITRNVA